VDALQQLQEIKPHCILLDVEMPRMDGFEFARNVRADDGTRGIPIIMITSRTADKHRNHAKEIGVNEYMGKPYQEDQLLALIKRYTPESGAGVRQRTGRTSNAHGRHRPLPRRAPFAAPLPRSGRGERPHPSPRRFAATDQVHDLRGKVTISNRPATWKSEIIPGDRIVTGNDGHFVFVMGQDAVMLRSRSELVIERYEESQGLLRLPHRGHGGGFRARALAAHRRVDLPPQVSAARGLHGDARRRNVLLHLLGHGGSRGDGRRRGQAARRFEAPHRQPHRARCPGRNAVPGREFRTHTDEEMDILEKCVGRALSPSSCLASGSTKAPQRPARFDTRQMP
jgi:hypothetical protein